MDTISNLVKPNLHAPWSGCEIASSSLYPTSTWHFVLKIKRTMRVLYFVYSLQIPINKSSLYFFIFHNWLCSSSFRLPDYKTSSQCFILLFNPIEAKEKPQRSPSFLLWSHARITHLLTYFCRLVDLIYSTILYLF